MIDVLAQIIADGGLVPHEDDWDRKRGTVRSVSLAKQRMYARLYAGMYMPNGKRLRNEYRSRYLWGYYFFGTAKLAAFLEYGFGSHVLDYSQKITRWTRKVSTQPHTLTSIFIQGTDIPNNYSILIGVKRGAVQFQYGSHFFNLHERRAVSPIRFEDMTHLEVPEANLPETTAALRAAGVMLPVLSLEAGEDYCRRFSFWQLVNGRPLGTWSVE
ncbi:MAG: hypothetical protein KGI41_03705 [Patescibacteria group bacterium]|nr:hypothetical protein [Patescibacteria group bacterium]MDE1966317.1 hypothetical protein [Patescibacteria group bacterium]